MLSNPTARELAAILVLTVIGLIFQASLLMGNRLPLDFDSLLFFFPLRALNADLSLGFWNPYAFCGFPREANPQSQLLYPPNAVFWLLSAEAGMRLLLVFHYTLGGILMYGLLRGLGLQRLSALAGGLAFLASTFWRCKITNLGLIEGIAWTPGVVYFFLLGLQQQRWPAYLASGVLLSLVMLAGVPHTVMYTLVGLLILTLAYGGWGLQRWLQLLLGYALTLFTAMALSLAMLFPAWLYLPQSVRDALPLQDALAGSVALQDILHVFLGGLSQPAITRADPWEGTCYIGITGLVIAAWSLKRMPLRLAVGMMALIVFAVLLTLGPQGGIYPLLHNLPVWNSLNLPNRSLMLAAWALPVLFAYGFQQLVNNPLSKKAPKFILLILAVVLLALGCVTFARSPNGFAAFTNPTLTSTFMPNAITPGVWANANLLIWAGVTLLAICAFYFGLMRRQLTGVILMLLVAAQSLQYTPRLFLQTIEVDRLQAPQTAKALHNLDDDWLRFCSYVPAIDIISDVRSPLVWDALAPRQAERLGLRSVQGYDPVMPANTVELLRQWAGQEPNTPATRMLRLNNLPDPLLRFLGITHVVGNPAQEILFRGREVLREPGVLSAALPQTEPVAQISMRWTLTGAAGIRNGQQVATVTVQNGTKTVAAFPVRAGFEIANQFVEYQGERAAHRSAPLHRWMPVPSPTGFEQAQQYRAVFDLPEPVTASQITLRYSASRGSLALMEAAYQPPLPEGYTPIEAQAELPIYAVNDPLGPVYFSRQPRTYDQPDEIANFWQEWNEQETVPVFFHVDQDIMSERSPVVQQPGNMVQVQSERIHSDLWRIEYQTPYDGWIVVQESHSPNWQAMLIDEQGNRRSAPVYRANHAFMAIPAAAGAFQIELAYRPTVFYYTLAVSGLGWVVALAALAATARQWWRPLDSFKNQ